MSISEHLKESNVPIKDNIAIFKNVFSCFIVSMTFFYRIWATTKNNE